MAGNDERLRAALGANAIFSGLCGLALLVAPGAWAAFIGLRWSVPLAALGAGLLAFAGLVAWTAADAAGRRPVARAIVAADGLWVIASAGTLLTFGGLLTPAGQWLIAVVAAIVAALGTAQWSGLRRLRPVDPGAMG